MTPKYKVAYYINTFNTELIGSNLSYDLQHPIIVTYTRQKYLCTLLLKFYARLTTLLESYFGITGTSMNKSSHKGSFTLVQIPQWTVTFLQRDRKIPISGLTQSTAESADHCVQCEFSLKRKEWITGQTTSFNKCQVVLHKNFASSF